MQKAGAELSVEKSKTESLKKDLDGLQKSAVAMKESLKKANSDMEQYRLEKESALEALQNAEAQAEQKSREMREELSRALAEKDKTIAEVETEKDAALSEMAELQEVINDLTLKRNEVAQKDAKIELLQSRVVSARAFAASVRASDFASFNCLWRALRSSVTVLSLEGSMSLDTLAVNSLTRADASLARCSHMFKSARARSVSFCEDLRATRNRSTSSFM